MSAGGTRGRASRGADGAAAGILLVCLVAAVYAPSLWLGFAYDDDTLILERRMPASLADVARSLSESHWPEQELPYYRPLPGTLLALQRYLHGDVPLPFHALNVALICAAVLGGRAFLRGRAVAVGPEVAWLGAALFAVHPVAASVVHPISGREALLAGLFAIAALELHLRARGPAARAAATLFFAAALFTREHAIAVPLLVALADGLRLSAQPPRRALDWLARQAPLAAVIALYLLLRSAALASAHPEPWLPPRFAWLPLASPLFALRASLAPGVALAYEPRPELWLASGRTLAAALGALLLLAAAVAAARRDSSARARLAFLLGFFALALLPSANFVHQETEFAERFVFLPWLALVGMVAICAQTLAGAPQRRRAVVAALAVAAIAACAAISVYQARYFRDQESFLLRWVESDPGYAKAHYSLGQHWLEQGRSDAARACFERALALEANYPAAHNNLGALAYQRGELAAAQAHWEQALRWDPNFAYALNNLAALRVGSGDLDGAAELYRRSLAFRPADARVHRILGSLELARGRAEVAREQLERALELDPEVELGHSELERARRVLEQAEAPHEIPGEKASAPE